MRGVVLDQPGKIRIAQVPDPAPGPGQIVVAVRACGVCGTDLHIAAGEFPPTPYPIIPGHEFAGEVAALGSGVSGLEEGDRVAVDPSLFCGRCRQCRRQRGNLCENWGAIGDTVDGAFAEYVAVPAANAYPVPDHLSFGEAALVEPISCAVHGLRRLAMPPGSTLLIIGAGTMGLLLAQLARRTGAASVTVVDTDPGRLTVAGRLGADATANSVADALEDEPGGFDYVIDATGVPAAAQAGLGAVSRGGTFMVFGVAPADARIAVSPYSVYNDEITIIGSMAVLSTFEPAMRLLAARAVDGAAMITDRFGLDDFEQALERVRARGGLKVQVQPDK